MQIELIPHDRDVTRFLWLKDVSRPYSQENVQEYRFCRVIWGIVSASFLLANTINYHLMTYNSETSRDIMNNLYVDNLITGTETTENAISYYRETKRMFEASMNMRAWISNDEKVMRAIDERDRCNDKYVNVLGMIWNVKEDTITVAKPKIIKCDGVITKRTILQQIASVFDPLGIYSPVMIEAKLLMQELWKKNFDWDDIIPEELTCRWTKIAKDLLHLDSIFVNRCIDSLNINVNVRYELITFSEASINTYAAAVYLRIVREDSVIVNLIYAKTRLSPIKDITIPRLELLGALIGCRALNLSRSN